MPWTLAFVLTIFPLLAAVNFYVGRKLLDALTRLRGWDRKRTRHVLAGILTYLNLLPVVFLIAYELRGRGITGAFAGDNFTIDLLFTYPFWIALVISVQLLVLYVVADIVKFTILRFLQGPLEWWQKKEPVFVFLAFVFIVLYSAATIVKDTWTVRVVGREVRLPPGFSSLDGFKIAQIADVQGDGRTTPDKIPRFVKRINALHPDLALFAGDLVTSGTRHIDSAAAVLSEIRATYGTYAAVGDHDIFSHKTLAVGALRRNRVIVVEDSTLFLEVKGTRVALSIVTYTYPQRPTGEKLEEVASELGNSYRIFLVHQPAETLVNFAQRKGYNLFIAGHTHGGGIAFGIPGLFLVAPASFETRYVSGFYDVGELVVSVTNGLGFTLAPIRFHAPAEITIITLGQ
jgi:predicted MPP superfamily phosphohydrolase